MVTLNRQKLSVIWNASDVCNISCATHTATALWVRVGCSYRSPVATCPTADRLSSAARSSSSWPGGAQRVWRRRAFVERCGCCNNNRWEQIYALCELCSIVLCVIVLCPRNLIISVRCPNNYWLIRLHISAVIGAFFEGQYKQSVSVYHQNQQRGDVWLSWA